MTFDSYVAVNPAKWTLGTSVPALSGVRGKIQLVRRFGATVAKGINATNWPDNTTFNVNNLSVQDLYQVPDNTTKWTSITDALSAAFSDTITGNAVKYTFPTGSKNFARLKVTGP
jgi:1-phosphatidylinositol phosphodiesterase